MHVAKAISSIFYTTYICTSGVCMETAQGAMPGDFNSKAFYGAGTSLWHASSCCKTLVRNWEGCVHIHR